MLNYQIDKKNSNKKIKATIRFWEKGNRKTGFDIEYYNKHINKIIVHQI